MKNRPVYVDERSTSVDNAAGNRAYQALNWLLVIDMGLHGFRPEWTLRNGFPVDIVLMIAAGALIWTFHAWRNQMISRRRISMMIISSATAAALAAVISGLKAWLFR